MKKHRASLIDFELFEYMSQSTFMMIGPLLILDDTLIYSARYCETLQINRHKKNVLNRMLDEKNPELTSAFMAPALKLWGY